MRYGKGWMVLLTLVGLAPGVGHAESAYIVDRLYAIMRTEAIETSPVAKTIESGTVVEVLQRTERFARVRDKQGAEGWVETRYLTVEPPMRVQLAKLHDDLTKARAQTAETQAQLKKALAEQTAHMKDMPKLAPGAPPLPVSDAPLRAQIAKLQDDLNKSRAQAADVQAQLKKTETALAEQTTKRKELEKTVASTPATPVAPLRAQIAKLEDDLNKSRLQATEAQTQLKKTETALAEQMAKRKELEKTVANGPVAPAAVAPAPSAPPATAKSVSTPAVAPPATATGFTFSFVWLGISFAMLGIGFAAGIAWLRESIRKRSGGMYLRV